ncbi:hypothetical protein SCA6_014027 [Theobroma cacao]
MEGLILKINRGFESVYRQLPPADLPNLKRSILMEVSNQGVEHGLQARGPIYVKAWVLKAGSARRHAMQALGSRWIGWLVPHGFQHGSSLFDLSKF